MALIRKVLLGLAVLIASFLGYVAIQPSDFRIVRSASIHATPDKLFTLIHDLHNFDKWSPWSKLDPNLNKSFAGPESGVGAIYNWSGNSDVGSGRMTVTKTDLNQTVEMKIDFFTPIAAVNFVRFTLTPQGTETLVSWEMTGQSNFVAKMFGTFVDVDKMVGNDFSKGLESLKSLSEN